MSAELLLHAAELIQDEAQVWWGCIVGAGCRLIDVEEARRYDDLRDTAAALRQLAQRA